MSIVESERGLEWLFSIWEAMTRKVNPFVLAKLFDDPRNTRFLSVYACESVEAFDAMTNVVERRAYGKKFGFGLTNGNETCLFTRRIRWITPSGTNESG